MEDEPRTGVVVVALPAADDPISAASSEKPSAHMTLAFLGDLEDLAGKNVTIDDIAGNVADWATRIDAPITEAVAGRAVLGKDQADVVLIDAAAFAQIVDGMTHEFAEGAGEGAELEVGADEQAPIAKAHSQTQQFPVWTPHVTLGYPADPALAEYTGESVTFDRLALWAGDDWREWSFGLGDVAGPADDPVADEIVAAGAEGNALLGEHAPPVDTRDPADTPQGQADEEDDDDTDTVDAAMPVPFHGIAAPTGIASDDGRMFATRALAWRALPLPLTFQYETAPAHFKSVVVGTITDMWYDEQSRIQYEGQFLPPSIEPFVDKVIGGIALGAYKGTSVDIVAAEYGDQYQNEQQVLDALANEGVELMTAGKVAGLCVVPITAFSDTYIALGPCDCPDEQVGDDVHAADEPADDGDDELVAAAFRAGLANLLSEDAEVREFARAVDLAAGEGPEHVVDYDAILAAAFAPGTHDGPGWITAPKATQRIRDYWVRGKGAAKIKWGAPNDFYRCRHQLVKYVQNPEYLSGLCSNMHKEATGVWPGQEDGGKKGGIVKKALTASGENEQPAAAWTIVASAAGDTLPDGSWFQDPKLTKPTPLTITEDGRVFGHVATWGTCHIGFSGKCVEPPRNRSGYAYYRTGTVKTTAGDVRVGHITMGTGHADVRQRAMSAAAHYDNTGTVGADVAAGDDGVGIWVAGAMRPGTTPENVYALRAAALSGDWRKIGGRMEMVAALAVNVPGFPVVDAIVASAGDYDGDEAIIAAGIVEQEARSDDAASLDSLVAAAVRAELDRRDRVARAFSALNDVTREDRFTAALAELGEI